MGLDITAYSKLGRADQITNGYYEYDDSSFKPCEDPSPSLNLEWQQLSYAKPQENQECWVVHRPAESDEIKHITLGYWSGEWRDGNGNPIDEAGINQAYHSDLLWIPSSQFASLEEARTDALEFAFDPF